MTGSIALQVVLELVSAVVNDPLVRWLEIKTPRSNQVAGSKMNSSPEDVENLIQKNPERFNELRKNLNIYSDADYISFFRLAILQWENQLKVMTRKASANCRLPSLSPLAITPAG